MKKHWAILLAVFTSWPPIFYILFIAIMMADEVRSILFEDPFEDNASLSMIPFELLFVAHLLTTILIIGLIALYLVHLFRTPKMPQDKKALWAVVLFLGNAFAMPVYWYLYIWRCGSSTSASLAIPKEST